MPSSVTVLGSNQTSITLTFDSSSNFSLGQQLASVINASVPGGHYLTSFDNVPPPVIPTGYAGGFYQTTQGSGGMPPGYTVDIISGPPNAFVTSSGLPDEIVMSDENTNLQFIAVSDGSGTVLAGGGTSMFSVPGSNGGNWELFSGAGNDVIARLPYVNNSQPGTPGGMAGKRDQTAYVFSTSAAITPGKTVQAVTLPAGGSIPAAGGPIRGMHIFALGVGPLSAQGVPLSGNDS